MRFVSLSKPKNNNLLLFEYNGILLHIKLIVGSEKEGKVLLGLLGLNSLLSGTYAILMGIEGDLYSFGLSFMMFAYSTVFSWLSFVNLKNRLRDESDIDGY
jgi:hypothetical protein